MPADDPEAEDVHRRLVRKIPGLLDALVGAFEDTLQQAPGEDSREMAARLSAGKATLSQIEVLLKLAERFRPSDGNAPDGIPDREDLIRQAREALLDDL